MFCLYQLKYNSQQQPEFESYGPKSCKIKSKNASENIPNELKESTEVKESFDVPLVKKLVSYDKLEKKTVVPDAAKIEFVKAKQEEKPVRKPVKYAEMYKSQESIKVFMDDFSVFGNSFDNCLNNLDKMLQRCEDTHLVLNWEKCHFRVKEGIVLGHKVSEASLKVDKVKIDVIFKLPPPLILKLLKKDTPFEFNDECHNAFKLLKEKLACAPLIVSPNWNLPFELMCDVSDFTVGAILGQKMVNFHLIYFASKTLNAAHQNCTITEKELMVVVFAFDKSRSYLVLSKTIVHTDHSALHLFKKQDAKPRLIRWILLLQEFDIKIKDRKGTKSIAADHLSRIENDETSDESKVLDNFPGETLMEINTRDEPWFADFANYLVSDIIPKGMTYQQKNNFSLTSNTTP
nr:reverse transcriptase domain-containing protein [Tanacetum cinerariifolium]